MSKFTSFNSIKPVPKSNKWITTGLLVFYENDDLIGKKYIVSEGFVFDGCSVGCPFGQGAKPRTISACCLHDRLFFQKAGFFKSNCMFYKALKANGSGFFERFRYYLGVTLFGWVVYFFKK